MITALAASRSEPVIRRAWEQETQTTEKWDAAIGGIRWYRHTGQNAAVTYFFQVEDDTVLPDPAVLESADLMRPAAYWKDVWPYGAQLWRDELNALPVVVPALAGPAPADLAAPAPVPTPHPHPAVASVRAPQYAPRGAYCWPVSMTTAAALAVRSWIIQHVVVTGDGVNADFYEAFEVPIGATASEEDIFQDEPEETNGSVKVVGHMQHISYSGGAPPPGMAIGAIRVSDGTQYTSKAAPPGWGAGGTSHELNFAWDDTAEPKVIRFITVPAGGDPVFKVDTEHLQTG
ncbi:MAG: hypothetical protein JWO68_1489 [Actinomycetia bacterium]|nr:hypothetical protein [Actinomycetes bacterium]